MLGALLGLLRSGAPEIKPAAARAVGYWARDGGPSATVAQQALPALLPLLSQTAHGLAHNAVWAVSNLFSVHRAALSADDLARLSAAIVQCVQARIA